MSDLPIVIPDTAVAPKDYTLSGTQELQLKTVRALIDGTGAASAFLPTLQLLDPNGHVMWEGATSSTVAAGGSADVSWFPGLGGQAGGTASVNNAETAYVWGIGTTMGTIPSGGAGTPMKWRHLNTTDTSMFGTDTSQVAVPPYHNADSDSFLFFNRDGAYVCSFTVRLAPGAYAQAALLNNPGSQWELDGAAGASASEDIATNTAAEGAFGQYILNRTHLFYVDATAGPGVVNVLLAQTSGVAKAVIEFNMGIMYLGGTTANLTTVY